MADTPKHDVHMEAGGFEALLSLSPEEECYMVNLIRFRRIAKYGEDDPEFREEPVSGQDAYSRYRQEVRPVAAPGEWIWEGARALTLIGPQSESWDLTFVRRYPTVRSFIEMIETPEYKTAERHRRAAVADSRLIVVRRGTLADDA